VINIMITKTGVLILALALAFIVMPASAGLLPPVQDPMIPAEGDTNFFFWNDSSLVSAHMNRFATYPQLQDTKLFSATVTAAGGDVTLGEFITDPFPSDRTLAPGLTRYRIYANVTSDVGTTTLNFLPFVHYANGTDERLFFGISRTVDVNTPTMDEYLISYARRNYTAFPAGSSLFIRVNASTTSVVARTINLGVSGTSMASMAQIGYWQIVPGVDVDTPSAVGSETITAGAIGGFIGGAGAIMYWKRRNKR
jgi:hypothetical protein